MNKNWHLSITLLFLTINLIRATEDIKPSIQTGHLHSIMDICFSYEGNMIASYDSKNNLILWNIYSELQILKKKIPETISCIEFSKKSDLLLFGTTNGILYKLDLSNFNISEVYKFESSINGIHSMLPDHVIIVHSDLLYRIDLDSLNKTILLNEEIVSFSAYNDSEQKFMLVDRNLDVWDYYLDGNIKEPIDIRINRNDILYSAIDSTIIGIGSKGRINITKKEDGNISTSLLHDYPEDKFIDIEYSSVGNSIFAACSDSKIYVKKGIHKRIKPITQRLNNHKSSVNALAVSKDGRLLASAGDDKTILIWDIDTLQVIKKLRSRSSPITCALFSPDGNSIVFGNSIGEVKSIKLDSTYFTVNRWQLGNYQINDIAINSCDQNVYSVDNTNKLKVFNLKDLNKKTESITVKSNPFQVGQLINNLLNSFAVVPDPRCVFTTLDIDCPSNYLVVRGKKQIPRSSLDYFTGEEVFRKDIITIYKLPKFKKRRRFSERNLSSENAYDVLELVDNLQISYKYINGNNKTLTLRNNVSINNFRFANGNILFTNDHKVWSHHPIEQRISHNGFNGNFKKNFTLSNNNEYIAYCEADTIYLKKVQGSSIKKLVSHNGMVNSLCFNPNNNWLLSSSDDASLKIWDVNEGSLIITIVPVDNEDAIFLTNENFYSYTTFSAISGIGFIQNHEVYNPEQFDFLFYKPDSIFSCFNMLPKAKIQEVALDRKQWLLRNNINDRISSYQISIPIIDIRTQDNMYESNTGKTNILINAIDSLYNIESIEARINGTLIYSSSDSNKVFNNKVIKENIKVNLSNGRNIIRCSARNSKGFTSYRKQIIVKNNQKHIKPNLYFVGVGLNYEDRTSPIHDVDTIIYSINKSKKIRKLYDHVYTFKIDNSNDTISIISLLNELKMIINKTSINDVLVLYLSGETPEGYDNKIAFRRFRNGSIQFFEQQQVEDLLSSADARKRFMVINSCQVGESYYTPIFNNHNLGNGTTVITPTSSRSKTNVVHGNISYFNLIFLKSIIDRKNYKVSQLIEMINQEHLLRRQITLIDKNILVLQTKHFNNYNDFVVW